MSSYANPAGPAKMGIEVMVDGQYFESITEGQWYSYFDEVGMSPVPQPVSVAVNQYSSYTPDFYLPHQDTYVEIKNGNVNQASFENANVLATKMGSMVLLIDGRPKQPGTTIRCIGSGPHADATRQLRGSLYFKMGELREANFFDESRYPYSRKIDQTAKQKLIKNRKASRDEALSKSIEFTDDGGAEILAQLKDMGC